MSSSRSLSVRCVDTDAGTFLVIEDACLGSGEVVDARLVDVPGATYDDARAKVKGRCFVLADGATPSLAQALRALGQPGAESASLPRPVLRDMLTGSMTRRILPWVAVGCVLTFAGIRSMCTAHHDVGKPSASVVSSVSAALTVEDVAVMRTVVERSRVRVDELEHRRGDLAAELAEVRAVGRCEPNEWPLCPKRGELCSPMPDGTDRRCRRRTRTHGAVELVCVPEVPGKEIKQWRRARLRTIVESVCDPRRGCRPNDLTNYLTILADRETSRRPWKRHRMDVDREAAARAWRGHEFRYTDSPAHDEPWRWATGLGYFGQNPALWLHRWDASAEPEALCGEVEAVLAHLRAARQRWKHVHGIFACGEDAHLFAGSSPEGERVAAGDSDGWGAPSWYDVSLVNSGSNACPAQPGERKRWEQRQSFERRAERFGLDPYEELTIEMLGAPVAREEQDAFAEDLYAKLGRE